MPPSIRSSYSILASTGTMPTHQAGDLIIVWATNNVSSTTAPAVPSPPDGTWTTIHSGNFSRTTSRSIRTAYKIAASSAESLGTWANSTRLTAVVIQQANGIGGNTWTGDYNSSNGFATAPAVTLSDPSGNSLLLHYYVQGSNVSASAPSGYTRVLTSSTTTALNRKNVSTSDGAIDETGAFTGSWIASTVEVLGLPAGESASFIVTSNVSAAARYAGAVSSSSSVSVSPSAAAQRKANTDAALAISFQATCTASVAKPYYPSVVVGVEADIRSVSAEFSSRSVSVAQRMSSAVVAESNRKVTVDSVTRSVSR